MRRMVYLMVALILAWTAPVLLSGCAGGRKLTQEREARQLAEERARKAEELARKAEIAQQEAEEQVRQAWLEALRLQDINFDFDSSEIRSDAAEILKDHAAKLKEFNSLKVQIEGHCDERGTIKYNLALGERRASRAKEYLEDLGISAGRMMAVSYGEERPLNRRHTMEAWAKNRRCTFVITER